MSFWDVLGKPKKLFKAKVPDVKEYIGRTVYIDGKPIVIETIVGNQVTPAFYEINGSHLINMLRFHAQMLGDTSITEEQFKEFEEIQFEVEKMPKRTAIDNLPKFPKGTNP